MSHKLVRGIIGNGSMVHRVMLFDNGAVSSPLCGSGQHARKFCTTSRTRVVNAPLTCTKCQKAEAEATVKSES